MIIEPGGQNPGTDGAAMAASQRRMGTAMNEEQDHTHAGMAVPNESGARFGVPGWHVNGSALAAVVGAAIDGCGPCQHAQLDVIQRDPVTLTRLVELSAIAVQGVAGGLPDSMTTESGPSRLGEHYRAMLRAGVDRVDDHTEMCAIATALTHAERRQAADDALDMLVGVLTMGGGQANPEEQEASDG
jgi:hypothetical protein